MNCQAIHIRCQCLLMSRGSLWYLRFDCTRLSPRSAHEVPVLARGRGCCEKCRVIPCAVRAEFQTRLLDLVTEPAPRREMCLAERRTVHTAIACRTDLCQLVKGSLHPLCIDSQTRQCLYSFIHYFSNTKGTIRG